MSNRKQKAAIRNLERKQSLLDKFSAENKCSRVSVSGKDELDSAASKRRKGSQTRLTGTAWAAAKREDSQSEMQNKDFKRFVIVAPEPVSSNCSVTSTFLVMNMGTTCDPNKSNPSKMHRQVALSQEIMRHPRRKIFAHYLSSRTWSIWCKKNSSPVFFIFQMWLFSQIVHKPSAEDDILANVYSCGGLGKTRQHGESLCNIGDSGPPGGSSLNYKKKYKN